MDQWNRETVLAVDQLKLCLAVDQWNRETVLAVDQWNLDTMSIAVVQWNLETVSSSGSVEP